MKDYGLMTFLNEQVSPIGEITKQHRANTKQKDIIDFKEWCKANKVPAGNGKVITTYVSAKKENRTK